MATTPSSGAVPPSPFSVSSEYSSAEALWPHVEAVHQLQERTDRIPSGWRHLHSAAAASLARTHATMAAEPSQWSCCSFSERMMTSMRPTMSLRSTRFVVANVGLAGIAVVVAGFGASADLLTRLVEVSENGGKIIQF